MTGAKVYDMPPREPAATPDHDLYAEQVVVAALLLGEVTAPELAEQLTPADLYDRRHKAIFEAALALAAGGAAVDLAGVAAWLRAAGRLGEVGIPYLTSLTDVPPGQLDGPLSTIRESARVRRMEQALGYAAARLRGPQRDRAGLLAEVAELVARATAEAPRAGQGLPVRSVAAWKGELPPTPWISQRIHLAPSRVFGLVGYSGVGKTLLAYDLAVAVASPGEGVALFWGGCVVNRKGRVLILDWEVGEGLSRARLTRLIAGRGHTLDDYDGRLDILNHPDLHLTDRDAERRLISTLTGYTLCILDSLTMIAEGADENSAGQFSKLLGLLSRVVDKTGCAIVLLHHAGKPPQDGSKRQAHLAARGTSAIQGVWGAQLLAANEDGALVLEWGKTQYDGGLPATWTCRVVDIGEAAPGQRSPGVAFQSTAVASPSDEAAPEPPSATLRAKRMILDYLGAVGEATYSELKARLKSINNTTFSRAVQELLVDERMFRTKEGRTVTYTLVQRSDATSSQHAPNGTGMRSGETSSQDDEPGWDGIGGTP